MTLRCGPSGGTHPHAAVACIELAKAAGDPGRLPGRPVMCALDYRPVVATAAGTWHGHAVSWHRVFASPCQLLAATGTVFSF